MILSTHQNIHSDVIRCKPIPFDFILFHSRMASKEPSMTTNIPFAQRTAILFVDPTVINDYHMERLQADLERLNLTLMIFF